MNDQNDPLTRMFKSLGHEKRLNILRYCAAARDGMTSIALEQAMKTSAANMHQHISDLVGAGLISRERSGKYQLLKIKPDALKQMLAALIILYDNVVGTEGLTDANSGRSGSGRTLEDLARKPEWPRQDASGPNLR